MNLSRAGALLYSSRLLGKVVTFLGIVYFANMIGAAAMGMFFLFQASLGILSIPADFGVRGAVEKRISEGTEAADRLLATGIALKVIPLVLISAALLALRGEVNEYVGGAVTVVIVASLFVREAALLAENVLRGELRVGETASLEVIRDVSWVASSVLLVWTGLEALALVYGWLIGHFLMALAGWYLMDTGIGKPAAGLVQSLFNYGKYRFVLEAGSKVFGWIDVAVLGFLVTQEAVGAYEVAWRVGEAVILVSSTIAKTIFPQISAWKSENRTEEISRVLRQALTATMVLAVPAVLGTVVLVEEILELVFGTEYGVAALALVVLMGQKLVQSVYNVFGYALQAIDRPDLSAAATVVSIAMNIGLNVVLIFRFGLVGAALATTIAYVVNTALHVFFLHDEVPIAVAHRDLLWIVTAALTMAAVVAATKATFAVTTRSALAGAVALGVVVYGCVLLLSHSLRTQIRGNLGWILGDDGSTDS